MFSKITTVFDSAEKYIETPHNEDKLLAVLENSEPKIIRAGLYSDALDMDYKRFGNAIYLTAFLNLSFSGELFISSSNKNVQASIPFTIVFDSESARDGKHREAIEKVGTLYKKELTKKLERIGKKFSFGSSFSEIAFLLFETEEEKEELLRNQ